MKKTLLKFLLCALCIIGALLLIFIASTLFAKNIDNQPPKTIYIWGDSEMYQGIDMDGLAAITGRNVTSSATHGNGVYDFLVFTNRIPDSSYCVLSFSTTCLTRVKEHDYNRLGVDIPSLIVLLNNDYTVQDVFTILHNNYFAAKPIFGKIESDKLYPHQDTICHTDKLTNYDELFHTEHFYEKSKWNIFLSGIDKLNKKHCTILLVVFPWHSSVYEKYDGSLVQKNMNKYIKHLSSHYCQNQIDSIEFNCQDSLCMYDLVHMNEIGAKRTTKVLGEYINKTHKSKQNHIIIINDMVCN